MQKTQRHVKTTGFLAPSPPTPVYFLEHEGQVAVVDAIAFWDSMISREELKKIIILMPHFIDTVRPAIVSGIDRLALRGGVDS